MTMTTRRPLTPREWGELSPGLRDALAMARVTPWIERRPHPGAHLARLRFGSLPIMAVGRTIWWPDAAPDFAGAQAMALLQHELQHVLDFAEGQLSIAGYLLLPRNWTYRWRLDRPWEKQGAEQRASMAEALWRAEHSPTGAETAAALRAIIPWAHG